MVSSIPSQAATASCTQTHIERERERRQKKMSGLGSGSQISGLRFITLVFRCARGEGKPLVEKGSVQSIDAQSRHRKEKNSNAPKQ